MSNVYGQTLLDDMVQQQGLPIPLVREAAKEILAVIREGLVRDGVVNVSNFGTFRLKLAAARNGYNPQTRERITIPAHQRVIFSPCKALRELIQPVQLAPTPIPAVARSEGRAAAKSAAIASAGAVATKRIDPVVKAAPEKTEEPTETPPPPLAQVATERRVTPDRRHSTARAETETTTTADKGPGQALANATGHTDESSGQLDTISLKMGDEPTTEGRSKKGLYLGAAAIIVIAAVSASLIYDSATDEPPVALVTTTPAPAGNAVTPLTDEGLAPITTVTPAIDAIPEIPGDTEAAPSQEIDDSTPYTEMANAQPDVGPAAETLPSESAPAPAPGAEVAAGQAAPVIGAEETRAQSKPTTFFFTEQTHTITDGESLWRLARSHYQAPLLWPHIYQANAALIDNPDKLRTGRTLTIPSLQGAPGKLTRTDRRNIAEGYYLTYLHYKKSGHKDAFFALLEAKRYDNKVVEEHRSLLQLSQVEEILLGQQETMPF